MIKIIKPVTPPKKILNNGVAENTSNIDLFEKNEADYIAGIKKIKIRPSIYGNKKIKAILKNAQFDKCCFCEKIQSEEYGAVEHFRPKNGFKNSKLEKKLIKPAYFWLGYNWDNLFFVCQFCNSVGNKGNLFPLKDESKRAISHKHDLNEEDHLLICPTGPKDPRQHIKFKEGLIFGVDEYGKKTIEICGLDRETLNLARQEKISNLEARILVLREKEKFTTQEINKAKEYIKNSIKPSSEFSGCAIDFLSQFKFSQSLS